MEEHHHHHGVDQDTNLKWISAAFILLFVFMIVEIIFGLIANSIAILSDAAHMLGDVSALALAVWASWQSNKTHERYTFGKRSLQTLSAQLNGISLILLAGILGFQAILRLINGNHEVMGNMMILIGLLGLIVNIIGLIMLSKASGENLNVKGARAHMIGDTLGSLGALIAGVIIIFTSWNAADPLIALMVCGWMLYSGVKVTVAANDVLLAKTPSGYPSAKQLQQEISKHPQIVDVHAIHFWAIVDNIPSFTAHLIVKQNSLPEKVRLDVERILNNHHIKHITLQIETEQEYILKIVDKRT